MDPVLHAISAALELFAPSQKTFIVAVSGGPDSQCLLHAMGALAQADPTLRIYAEGLDHGLREAANDELQIARQLAEELNIPFNSHMLDVATKGNTLANARRERYAYLRTRALELEHAPILTGHTATDQLETVLLNLSRGSGLKGSGGMAQFSRGILRPLLGISRPEIMQYIEHHALPYALDPSNEDPERARTQLRDSVIPALRALNPKADHHFNAYTQRAREAEDYIAGHAMAWCESHMLPANGLEISLLLEEPPALVSAVVRLWLTRVGLSSSRTTLEQVRKLISHGRGTLSVDGELIELSNAKLWRPSRTSYTHRLSVPGKVSVGHMGLELEAKIANDPSGPLAPEDYRQQTRKFVAFDLDQLHLDLVVRAWQPGDKLKPFGLEGTLTIGDLFTNLKVARPLRLQWPVVTAGNDVIWVAGLRRSAVAPITQMTRDVLQLECRQSSAWAPWGLFDD